MQTDLPGFLDALGREPAALAAALAALLSFVAAVGALGAWFGQRAGERALHTARIMAEQAQAGQRAEAEMTRRALDETRAALATGIETVRTTLAYEQGTLRLHLVEHLDLRLQRMREGNERKLDEIRAAVHEQLHAAVEKQMTESFARVIDQFAAVQKAMGDVQAVTAQIGDIKRLFGNVKTRGGWGEAQARAILDDVLAPGTWSANRKLRADSDEMVDFAVTMPARGDAPPLLPIDVKFPTEDYERLVLAAEAGDAEQERASRRALERRIRDEAKRIAAKYVHPPATVDFAIMYLPTDGLYAEVARVPGLIDTLGRECRVLVLGPTLLPALLRTIRLGHVTLTMEARAQELGTLLAATRREMLTMDEVLARLAKQAGQFGTTIDAARQRTRVVGARLRGLESMEPPERATATETDTELWAEPHPTAPAP
jgi:DNA recombination protein RmuC